MVDLPLPGNFTSFLALVAGFFEEPPLGFLMTVGEGLAFLAGVLALGGAFLGKGLAFPRWAAETLGVGLDPLCFTDVAFPGDLAGVFFCNLLLGGGSSSSESSSDDSSSSSSSSLESSGSFFGNRTPGLG